MANIKEWLIAVEQKFGEPIEAIVVGKHDDRTYGDKAFADENIILSRQDGLAKLDAEYDNGYGGADCFPMYAWTASRVFFIREYDGSTGISSVPRAPVACEPEFDGNSPAFM